MIGTMEFIKCAGSLMTSEYPLLTADSDMDSYVVMKYDNVHFIEDMKQVMTMPSFDGWSGCNMVRFTESGTDTPWIAYYWITDAARSSTSQGSTDFMLEFDAPTTLLKKGDKVNGQWLRSPVNYTPWKQQAIVSGTNAFTTHHELIADKMPIDYTMNLKPTLWVSITASKNPSGQQGTYEIYGFPIAGYTLTDIYADSTPRCNAPVLEGSTWGKFPSLHDIFGGETLSAIGLTTSEILDIAITPFQVFDTSYTNKCIALMDSSGNTIAPTRITYNDGTSDVQGTYWVYNITGSIASKLVPHITTSTITLSASEMACGQISVVKGDGTILANIPTSWATETADGTYEMTVKSQTIADYSQLNTLVRIIRPDNTNLSKGLFTIPCDHIPYIGNQWDNYRAYSMSYDREAMQFGIDQARNAMIANVVTGVATAAVGVATGGVAFAAKTGVTAAAQVANTMGNVQTAASTGSGVIGSIVGYYQQKHAAEFNQALTERRTQTQPGNAYNTAYGIFQLYMTMTWGLQIVISMPDGLDEATFNEFVENFGYANEGEYEMPMDYGFYQGTIYTSPTMTGPRLVELINAMNAGIRMIKPSGNTKD